MTPSQPDRSWQQFLQFGWTSALLVVTLILGGNWLDHRFGTWPWLFLVGAGLGLAASVRLFISCLKKVGTPPL